MTPGSSEENREGAKPNPMGAINFSSLCRTHAAHHPPSLSTDAVAALEELVALLLAA